MQYRSLAWPVKSPKVRIHSLKKKTAVASEENVRSTQDLRHLFSAAGNRDVAVGSAITRFAWKQYPQAVFDGTAEPQSGEPA